MILQALRQGACAPTTSDAASSDTTSGAAKPKKWFAQRFPEFDWHSPTQNADVSLPKDCPRTIGLLPLRDWVSSGPAWLLWGNNQIPSAPSAIKFSNQAPPSNCLELQSWFSEQFEVITADRCQLNDTIGSAVLTELEACSRATVALERVVLSISCIAEDDTRSQSNQQPAQPGHASSSRGALSDKQRTHQTVLQTIVLDLLKIQGSRDLEIPARLQAAHEHMSQQLFALHRALALAEAGTAQQSNVMSWLSRCLAVIETLLTIGMRDSPVLQPYMLHAVSLACASVQQSIHALACGPDCGYAILQLGFVGLLQLHHILVPLATCLTVNRNASASDAGAASRHTATAADTDSADQLTAARVSVSLASHVTAWRGRLRSSWNDTGATLVGSAMDMATSWPLFPVGACTDHGRAAASTLLPYVWDCMIRLQPEVMQWPHPVASTVLSCSLTLQQGGSQAVPAPRTRVQTPGTDMMVSPSARVALIAAGLLLVSLRRLAACCSEGAGHSVAASSSNSDGSQVEGAQHVWSLTSLTLDCLHILHCGILGIGAADLKRPEADSVAHTDRSEATASLPSTPPINEVLRLHVLSTHDLRSKLVSAVGMLGDRQGVLLPVLTVPDALLGDLRSWASTGDMGAFHELLLPSSARRCSIQYLIQDLAARLYGGIATERVCGQPPVNNTAHRPERRVPLSRRYAHNCVQFLRAMTVSTHSHLLVVTGRLTGSTSAAQDLLQREFDAGSLNSIVADDDVPADDEQAGAALCPSVLRGAVISGASQTTAYRLGRHYDPHPSLLGLIAEDQADGQVTACDSAVLSSSLHEDDPASRHSLQPEGAFSRPTTPTMSVWSTDSGSSPVNEDDDQVNQRTPPEPQQFVTAGPHHGRTRTSDRGCGRSPHTSQDLKDPGTASTTADIGGPMSAAPPLPPTTPRQTPRRTTRDSTPRRFSGDDAFMVLTLLTETAVLAAHQQDMGERKVSFRCLHLPLALIEQTAERISALAVLSGPDSQTCNTESFTSHGALSSAYLITATCRSATELATAWGTLIGLHLSLQQACSSTAKVLASARSAAFLYWGISLRNAGHQRYALAALEHGLYVFETAALHTRLPYALIQDPGIAHSKPVAPDAPLSVVELLSYSSWFACPFRSAVAVLAAQASEALANRDGLAASYLTVAAWRKSREHLEAHNTSTCAPYAPDVEPDMPQALIAMHGYGKRALTYNTCLLIDRMLRRRYTDVLYIADRLQDIALTTGQTVLLKSIFAAVLDYWAYGDVPYNYYVLQQREQRALNPTRAITEGAARWPDIILPAEHRQLLRRSFPVSTIVSPIPTPATDSPNPGGTASGKITRRCCGFRRRRASYARVDSFKQKLGLPMMVIEHWDDLAAVEGLGQQHRPLDPPPSITKPHRSHTSNLWRRLSRRHELRPNRRPGGTAPTQRGEMHSIPLIEAAALANLDTRLRTSTECHPLHMYYGRRLSMAPLFSAALAAVDGLSLLTVTPPMYQSTKNRALFDELKLRLASLCRSTGACRYGLALLEPLVECRPEALPKLPVDVRIHQASGPMGMGLASSAVPAWLARSNIGHHRTASNNSATAPAGMFHLSAMKSSDICASSHQHNLVLHAADLALGVRDLASAARWLTELKEAAPLVVRVHYRTGRTTNAAEPATILSDSLSASGAAPSSPVDFGRVDTQEGATPTASTEMVSWIGLQAHLLWVACLHVRGDTAQALRHCETITHLLSTKIFAQATRNRRKDSMFASDFKASLGVLAVGCLGVDVALQALYSLSGRMLLQACVDIKQRPSLQEVLPDLMASHSGGPLPAPRPSQGGDCVAAALDIALYRIDCCVHGIGETSTLGSARDRRRGLSFTDGTPSADAISPNESHARGIESSLLTHRLEQDALDMMVDRWMLVAAAEAHPTTPTDVPPNNQRAHTYNFGTGAPNPLQRHLATSQPCSACSTQPQQRQQSVHGTAASPVNRRRRLAGQLAPRPTGHAAGCPAGEPESGRVSSSELDWAQSECRRLATAASVHSSVLMLLRARLLMAELLCLRDDHTASTAAADAVDDLLHEFVLVDGGVPAVAAMSAHDRADGGLWSPARTLQNCIERRLRLAAVLGVDAFELALPYVHVLHHMQWLAHLAQFGPPMTVHNEHAQYRRSMAAMGVTPERHRFSYTGECRTFRNQDWTFPFSNKQQHEALGLPSSTPRRPANHHPEVSTSLYSDGVIGQAVHAVSAVSDSDHAQRLRLATRAAAMWGAGDVGTVPWLSVWTLHVCSHQWRRKSSAHSDQSASNRKATIAAKDRASSSRVAFRPTLHISHTCSTTSRAALSSASPAVLSSTNTRRRAWQVCADWLGHLRDAAPAATPSPTSTATDGPPVLASSNTASHGAEETSRPENQPKLYGSKWLVASHNPHLDEAIHLQESNGEVGAPPEVYVLEAAEVLMAFVPRLRTGAYLCVDSTAGAPMSLLYTPASLAVEWCTMVQCMELRRDPAYQKLVKAHTKAGHPPPVQTDAEAVMRRLMGLQLIAMRGDRSDGQLVSISQLCQLAVAESTLAIDQAPSAYTLDYGKASNASCCPDKRWNARTGASALQHNFRRWSTAFQHAKLTVRTVFGLRLLPWQAIAESFATDRTPDLPLAPPRVSGCLASSVVDIQLGAPHSTTDAVSASETCSQRLPACLFDPLRLEDSRMPYRSSLWFSRTPVATLPALPVQLDVPYSRTIAPAPPSTPPYFAPAVICPAYGLGDPEILEPRDAVEQLTAVRLCRDLVLGCVAQRVSSATTADLSSSSTHNRSPSESTQSSIGSGGEVEGRLSPHRLSSRSRADASALYCNLLCNFVGVSTADLLALPVKVLRASGNAVRGSDAAGPVSAALEGVTQLKRASNRRPNRLLELGPPPSQEASTAMVLALRSSAFRFCHVWTGFCHNLVASAKKDVVTLAKRYTGVRFATMPDDLLAGVRHAAYAVHDWLYPHLPRPVRVALPPGLPVQTNFTSDADIASIWAAMGHLGAAHHVGWQMARFSVVLLSVQDLLQMSPAVNALLTRQWVALQHAAQTAHTHDIVLSNRAGEGDSNPPAWAATLDWVTVIVVGGLTAEAMKTALRVVSRTNRSMQDCLHCAEVEWDRRWTAAHKERLARRRVRLQLMTSLAHSEARARAKHAKLVRKAGKARSRGSMSEVDFREATDTASAGIVELEALRVATQREEEADVVAVRQPLPYLPALATPGRYVASLVRQLREDHGLFCQTFGAPPF